MTPAHLRTRILAFALLAFAAAPAAANPWIPASGSGTAKPVVRFYSSDRAFPSGEFGGATQPGTSRYEETQVKVTGDYGLGNGWAVQYDLRAAADRKVKTRHQAHDAYSATGPQDQEIGLVCGLRQGNTFADAVALNVVLPTGPTSPPPALGVGHAAVQPEYQFGFRRRFGARLAYGSFSVAPRIFLNSGVTQLRATADVGTRLVGRLDVFGTVFLSRTYGANHRTAVNQNPNAAEDYNLLRSGIGLRFRLTRNVRPVVAYETDLAGQSIHAGQRFILGVSLRY